MRVGARKLLSLREEKAKQHTPVGSQPAYFSSGIRVIGSKMVEGPATFQTLSRETAYCLARGHILVEYFYGDGSPLFLRRRQMTYTPQNFIKNIIFKPQYLPGDVKMAPGDVKMAPGDVKL